MEEAACPLQLVAPWERPTVVRSHRVRARPAVPPCLVQLLQVERQCWPVGQLLAVRTLAQVVVPVLAPVRAGC